MSFNYSPKIVTDGLVFYTHPFNFKSRSRSLPLTGGTITDLTSSFVAGLKSSVSGTKKLCFVEEGSSFVSFSSEVTANLVENAQGEFALLRIANNWIIPSSRERERNILPDSNSIKQNIIKFLYE